jgi:hypothetical protein
MRPDKIAGLLLLVLAFAVVPFAIFATFAWGFLAFVIGLSGVVLLFRAPAMRSDMGAVNQLHVPHLAGFQNPSDHSLGIGEHSVGVDDHSLGGGDGGSDGGP